jgi:hypothetical protein
MWVVLRKARTEGGKLPILSVGTRNEILPNLIEGELIDLVQDSNGGCRDGSKKERRMSRRSPEIGVLIHHLSRVVRVCNHRIIHAAN